MITRTPRKRLIDVRTSRIPQTLGACAADSNRLLAIVNEAQERLLIAGGEAGWWGTWYRMAFTVDPAWPYITCPRTVARLINVATCDQPVRIQNQFYEFLDAGYGLKPSGCSCVTSEDLQFYDRGTVPTNLDLVTTGNPKKLRFYVADARDYDKRVLVQGKDQNGNVIRSLDNGVDVQGFFLTLATPFVESTMTLTEVSGLQKDLTVDNVTVYEVDSVTAATRLISTMEPGEEVACYRRYYINQVPDNCCDGADTVQVQAMAKLEFVPVVVDTDYLIIENLPALKLECEAVRYSEMDSEKAQKMSLLKHSQAIRMLNKELEHRLGKERPAIHFAPFGSATLESVGVGMT
jgi:hypothetical protein